MQQFTAAATPQKPPSGTTTHRRDHPPLTISMAGNLQAVLHHKVVPE
jgi:hypothetical protein